jgi:hypothetical protein
MHSDFASIRFLQQAYKDNSKQARAAFDQRLVRGGMALQHTRRRHLQLIAAAAITPTLPRVGRAQSWPARPIRVIIPFSAGSTIDIVARIVSEPLGQQLGQALVIENRGGTATRKTNRSVIAIEGWQ